MDDNEAFHVLNQLVKARQDDMEEARRQGGKQRLRTVTSTKIRTTMIGALAVFEEVFGDDFKAEFRSQWEAARARILDLGNSQIRKFDAELDNYDVTWKRYHYNFQMRDRNDD